MPREVLPKMEDGVSVDYLEEDPEVPTQKYAILSFISPEKVLKTRDEFFNEKFLEWLDYEWKIKGMEKYNAFLATKYGLKIENLFADLTEFTKLHQEDVKKTDIHELHEVFLLKCEKDVDAQFSESVDFRTNVRGVKVRRVFASAEEAQTFAKVLQRRYPKDNLFIGKVGVWLAWDPSEHLMPEVEYATQELNELMRKHKENEVNKEIFFEEEKAEKIKAQRDENKKRNALKESLETPIHPAEGAIRDA